jgi:hypothetical protein
MVVRKGKGETEAKRKETLGRQERRREHTCQAVDLLF